MDRADLSVMPRLLVTADEGRRTAVPQGQLSALILAHGSMELRWYAPHGDDPQTPHDRDELYVIVAGTGIFVRAEEHAPFADDQMPSLRGADRVDVKPGDALFVPAGAHHRFESISPDFGAWMVFYGPEGGEQPWRSRSPD